VTNPELYGRELLSSIYHDLDSQWFSTDLTIQGIRELIEKYDKDCAEYKKRMKDE
jgi:hypothetical protein